MAARKRHIMIVEDDDLYAVFLTHYLRNNLGEVNINVFTNGQDGLVGLEHGKYDVMILDYFLDDMTGLEVLQEAKKRQPELVVIVLSANKKLEAAIDLMKAGAMDYLEKNPDSAFELIKALERIFEAKELEERTLTISLNLSKNRPLRIGLIVLGLIGLLMVVLNLYTYLAQPG